MGSATMGTGASTGHHHNWGKMDEPPPPPAAPEDPLNKEAVRP